MRVGLHRGLDLGGDIGPLGVQGDELAGQVQVETSQHAQRRGILI